MKIFDIVLFEEQIVLQVTEPLLEQLTGDELNGILEYYKEDFNIGGYTYQKEMVIFSTLSARSLSACLSAPLNLKKIKINFQHFVHCLSTLRN